MSNLKKVILIIVATTLQHILSGQSAPLQWAVRIGNSNTTAGACIKTDAFGNVYTFGGFSGTVDFDPGPGVYNLTSSFDDIFISKLDAAGNFVWAKKIGGTSNDDRACILDLDLAGNIYLGGNFGSTVDFDPGPSVYNMTALGPFYSPFVCKLDAAGNFLWAKQFSGTSGSYGYALAVDPQGNVYAAGTLYGTTDMDPGSLTFTLSPNGQMDGYICKLNPTGNFIWAKQLGGNTDDECYSIATDANGNVYTTGYFKGTADFDPGLGTYNLISAGNTDIFVSKLDSTGNFTWAKKMGGIGFDYGSSIAIDTAFNIHTTGNCGAFADFDPGPSIYQLNSSGSTDIFVSKLDALGNFLWAKNMGGSSNDYGNSIALDQTGNVYTSGFFQTGGDFDPGPGFYNLTTSGLADIFFSKLDINGNFVWAKKIGGTGNDGCLSIFVDGNGLFYATGHFMNTVDFDPEIPTFTYTATGQADTFILKLCQAVTPTISSNGPTTFCMGNNVILNSSAANSYSWSTGAITQSITVSVAGNYYVIANINGCAVTTTLVSVAVNPLPTITVNSGSICAGNSFTMIPSGANSYTFSGGVSVVSPTNNMSYTVTGSSAAGCISNIAMCNLTVQPFPLPTITVNSGTTCAGDSFTLTPSGANTYTFSAGTSIVSPSISSSYSITGTDANGCVTNTPAIANITVSPLPIISVNSTFLCPGQSFTIIPTGANTYTFSSGSAVVTPTVSTVYSVTGTSIDGCITQNPAQSFVTLLSSPTITILNNTPLICAGQNSTLTASGANSYLWSSGGNSATEIITPTVTTTYTVTGMGFNSCQTVATITQSVNICTGLFHENITSGINIYPNPAKGILNIENNLLITKNDANTVQIFNSSGELILSEPLNSKLSQINISSLKGGLYLINIKIDSAIKTCKIIKE